MNAGAALYASEKAASIGEGIEMARESIDSGKAHQKLKSLAEITQNA